LNVLYLALAFLYASGFGSPLTRVERASSDMGDEELCNRYVTNGASKIVQPKNKYPRSPWRVADPSNNGTPRCGRGLCGLDPRPAGACECNARAAERRAAPAMPELLQTVLEAFTFSPPSSVHGKDCVRSRCIPTHGQWLVWRCPRSGQCGGLERSAAGRAGRAPSWHR
jgi:hypothetical protein